MKKLLTNKLFTLGALAIGMGSFSSQAFAETSACLITKTDTNPFFVKMKEGATAKAEEMDIELKTFDAGLVVIALDTPLEPIDSADATFATDNFLAGELIGKWAASTLGDAAADAKIGMLDLAVSQPSVGVLRDQGFLQGFGIDLGDPNKWGDEEDPRIVGNDVTAGNEEGGRKAMENLLAKDPMINVVYTINEPAAAGAYEALKSIGRESDVLIVSVDGGCPGVADVKDGVIGATSQQYPLLMASLGIEAIVAWAKDGTKPEPTPGKDFFDTGVALITDKPVEGVESIDTEVGTDRCWG